MKMRMCLSSHKFIFTVSFVFGACLAVMLHIYQQAVATSNSHRIRAGAEKDYVYDKWLRRQGLRSVDIDPDIGRYNSSAGEESLTEASFLYKNINVACLVFPSNVSSATTIKNTWGNHCNSQFFFSHIELQVTDNSNDTSPVVTLEGVNSAFHLLCDSLRRVLQNEPDVKWVLVATENTFAILENLRYYVASMNYSEPHYLGHAMHFWGEVYNWENAGYVLSRGTLEAFTSKFSSSEQCRAGGKYWKNGDWYLGKHLSAMGIEPQDTRDHLGRGRFNGYSFKKLLFPGGVSLFERYWRDSLYLSKDGPHCCSNSAITFHGILSHSKMYQLEYMFHHMRPFYSGGKYGNVPAETKAPKESFLTLDEKLKYEAMGHFLETLMTTPMPLDAAMVQQAG